ncbi:GldG family protein [Candidatus Marithrix sp. Canyon 246]|uniref:GldG family protein n=1 Tax=Candidatus Marithrix sp. Canyon 246 TaxID=1827136 RepID=UPI00084A1AC9|nr:GldG family protein [Candidatus Marithrix sp. Canyon 246]
MEVTKRTHLQTRLQNTVFMLLLLIVIALIAWLSTRYKIEADWTINNRHTLSEASVKLLVQLKDPIKITAYASNDKQLRAPIKDLVARYQNNKDDISLRFVDPFTSPNEVREKEIKFDGEVIIEYQNRTEHIRQVSEQTLTSALQRVVRNQDSLIVFLEGHGERSISQAANHDLSAFANTLKNSGFKLQSLNLTQADIPKNTALLVIASSRAKLLPGEADLITQYIKNNGNLLWLIDPNSPLNPIASQFGLTLQPGIIIDPNSELMGLNNPAMLAINDTGYADHNITANFNYVTLFPQAKGLIINSTEEWVDAALLTSSHDTWSEIGSLEVEKIEYNQGKDIEGPFEIAVALQRDKQRVVIVGEGDFLSNAFLQFGGNLNLGLKIINWLSQDDSFIDIPAKAAADLKLELSSNAVLLLGLLFLVVLPLILISIGISVWLRRRKA